MNHLRLYFKFFFVLAALSALHLAVGASEDPGSAVGRVVALRGEVNAITDGGELRGLAVKDPVFLQDTIETKAGRVQLMFTDDTLITVGYNSRMRIETYLYAPGNKDSALTTEIKEGSFRVMGGAITRLAPDNFKTRTPSGTIGIRGSMYAGVVEGERLTVFFQGGKGIYVENDMGRVEIAIPGFGTTVGGSGQAPETPAKFEEDQIKQIEDALDWDANEESGVKEEKGKAAKTQDTPGEPSETDAYGDAETADTEEDTDGAAFPEENSLVGGNSPVGELVTIASQEAVEESLTPEEALAEQQILALLLSEYEFQGERSTTVPTAGLTSYSGIMEILTPEMETEIETITIAVNWQNGRFMGISYGTGTPMGPGSKIPGFAFGQITSTGRLENVNVLGGGGPDVVGVTTLSGSEVYGHIYDQGYGDAEHGGIGLVIDGYDINVQDQSVSHDWSNTLAAVLDDEITEVDTGTENFKGFFIGVAEDMGAPETDRRVFVNSDPNDFQIAVNKDLGVISGTMNGYDYAGSSWVISGLQIGGDASNSVWVSDKDMAAELFGTTGTFEDTDTGDQTGLKDYGNYLVEVAPMSASAYTYWGYWESAYTEPGTGKDYHIHIPGAMWIAGNQTPATAVNSLIATGFTARYTGSAEGVGYDTVGEMFSLNNGVTDLNINFDAGATAPVYGTISFDEASFDVTGTNAVNSDGFKADITNVLTGEVNGTFYGPGAEGIGGNFSAEMATGEKYHGIFAGDR